MRKSLLTLLLAGGIAASATAADVTFSYAYDCDQAYGTQKKETYDVAIFLPGEAFAGFKVKGIKGPLNNSSGYKDGAAWLSSELKLDGKKNSPDMGYFQCPVNTDGVNYTLAAPVTIPTDGIYVGFSFAVDKLDNNTKYPVKMNEDGDANTMFIHSSKSYPSSWVNFGADKGYAAGIVVTLEVDNLKENNVTVASLPASVFLELDKAATFDAKLFNSSSNEVKSVDIEYTLGANTYSQHTELATPAPAGIGVPFNVTIDVPAQTEKTSGDVTVKVTKVNGVANTADNGTGIVYITVVTEMPVHQALFEEYTGTWCGWCTRGYAALEYIKKNYPDFVVAAYHNGDGMTITNDYPASISGFPAASLDRIYVGDPYAGFDALPASSTKLPVVGQIEAVNAQDCAWGVKAKAHVGDDNIVSVESEVFNLGRVTNNKYKLAYILISDGLTSPSWTQSNYYNTYSQSAENIDELNNFCSGGIYGTSSVKNLVFDDVVISDQGFKGVAGSMPSDLEPEEYYQNTYTWDVNGNKLVQDKSKLFVIVSILNENGKNVNCCKVPVEVLTGVNTLDTDANAPAEYYNLNGVRVANPEKGIFIKKQGGKTTKVAF